VACNGDIGIGQALIATEQTTPSLLALVLIVTIKRWLDTGSVMRRRDFVTSNGTLRLCHSRAWLPREGIPVPGFGSSQSKPRSRHAGL